jgi:hypothetical protein
MRHWDQYLQPEFGDSIQGKPSPFLVNNLICPMFLRLQVENKYKTSTVWNTVYKTTVPYGFIWKAKHSPCECASSICNLIRSMQIFGCRRPISTKYAHIKSTTVYAPRRNWDSPNPFLASECSPPPRNRGGGGTRHTSLRVGGWGESQFRRGAYTVVLFICTYFVPISVPNGSGNTVCQNSKISENNQHENIPML